MGEDHRGGNVSGKASMEEVGLRVGLRGWMGFQVIPFSKATRMPRKPAAQPVGPFSSGPRWLASWPLTCPGT